MTITTPLETLSSPILQKQTNKQTIKESLFFPSLSLSTLLKEIPKYPFWFVLADLTSKH